MKAKYLIQALRQVFLGRRREGHTTAMMKGAINTEKAVVIVADMAQRDLLEREFGVTAIPLSDLGRLTGVRCPVLIDHHAADRVLGTALREIEDRERQLLEIASQLELVAEKIRKTL